MADINHLVKLAQAYHRRAVYAQQSQALQYAMSIVYKMVGLANGGIASVKHLLSKNPSSHSPGLSALKERLPDIVRMLNGYTPSNNDDAFLASLGTILDGLSFYTNKGNSGTGYDDETNISDGGYTPPAYYITYLLVLFKKLKTAQQKNTHSPWEPTNTNKDPISVSLINQQNKSQQKT